MPLSMLTTLALEDDVVKSAKYLVTEDDGTTHLPYTDESGKIDHGRMGGAWAALHGGYRGSTYEGPNKAKALAKLKALYLSERMDIPVEKGGTGSGPSGSAAPVTALQARKDMIKTRTAATRARVKPPAQPTHPSAMRAPVLKEAAAQARHIDSGKFLPGRDTEASSQAHSASFVARTASQEAQARGSGDQSERHSLAEKAHLKAAGAHDRAAKASAAASRPAMAAYHEQSANRHRETASTHAQLSDLFKTKLN